MIKKIIVIFLGVFCMTIKAKQFENWAKNQKCEVNILTPKNTQELSVQLEKIKKEKATIRAYGTGHSWSDIICGANYLVDTSKLNKIISVDKKTNQVRVQTGIKLEELNKKLHKLNLCLSNQGAITKQSLAGVVSTATHGSGKTGTYASFITEVQLLTAQGQLINISKKENENFFDAVRTSIGSLGIMTEFTV
jgi:L-gulonolactone oxidase